MVDDLSFTWIVILEKKHDDLAWRCTDILDFSHMVEWFNGETGQYKRTKKNVFFQTCVTESRLVSK
jgi:hypothetical protein